LEDLLTSKKRLRGLEIFPRYSFQLSARDDGQFDLTMHAEEENGFGPNRWAALLSTFRGTFYDTICLEYFNAGNSGRNITSLARWDPQKRRLSLSYSSPLEQNPKYRYILGIDLRNENWAITPSSQASAPILGALNLQTQVLKVGISSFNSGRWDWFMGTE